jgi:hypothetical protein
MAHHPSLSPTIILSLVLSVLFSASLATPFYFKPSGVSSWSGSYGNECSNNAPCNFDNPVISSVYRNNVDLTFMDGNWTNPVYWESDVLFLTIHIGNVSNLQLTLNVTGHVYIIPPSSSPIQFSYWQSGNMTVIMRNIEYDITVANMGFSDVEWLLQPFNLSSSFGNITFKDGFISMNDTRIPIVSKTPLLSITFDHMNLSSIYAEYFITVASNTSLSQFTLNNTLMIGKGLCQIYSIENFLVNNSYISFSGPVLAQTTEEFFTHVSFQGSTIFGLISTAQNVINNSVDISVNRTRITNANIIATRQTYVKLEQSQFIRGNVTINTPILLINGSSFQAGSANQLRIYNSSGSAPSLVVTMTGVIPSYHPFPFLLLEGEVHLTANSSITSPALALSPLANVSLGNLTLSSFVGAIFSYPQPSIRNMRPKLSASPRNFNSPPLTPNWIIPSIQVRDVQVSMKDLELLTYRPSNTNPSLGIVLDNSDFDSLPSFVRIDWTAASGPIKGEIYDIVSINGINETDTVTALRIEGDRFIFEIAPLEPPFLSFRISPPPPIPPECPQPIPNGFECENGILIAKETVSEPVVTIPPNAGTVQVLGNVTISTTLTFSGFGSSLNSSGCVSISDGIVLDLSKTKDPVIPQDEVTLVRQSEACSTSLIDIPVSVNAGKTCKKISAKPSTSSTPSQLNVLFVLDKSSCNTKWIIVGSILGALVIIGAATVAIMWTCHKNGKVSSQVAPTS